jgi:hypothetical protein
MPLTISEAGLFALISMAADRQMLVTKLAIYLKPDNEEPITFDIETCCSQANKILRPSLEKGDSGRVF